MTEKGILISDATALEQGSFCSVASGYQYDNAAAVQTIAQEQSELNEGSEAFWLDKSIGWDNPEQAIEERDRFNTYQYETDNQGVEIPRQYEPGATGYPQ